MSRLLTVLYLLGVMRVVSQDVVLDSRWIAHGTSETFQSVALSCLRACHLTQEHQEYPPLHHAFLGWYDGGRPVHFVVVLSEDLLHPVDGHAVCTHYWLPLCVGTT